jgi:hypothetical protein
MSILSEERQQLVEDIHYLEYLISVEKQDIKERITKRINNSAPLTEQISSISDELSAVLGQFSARIALLEKSLINDQLPKLVPEKKPDMNQSSTNLSAVANVEETLVSIVDIGLQNGLGTLRHNKDKAPFHYVMPNASVNFNFNINRLEKKTLVVEVIKVSDRSFLDKISIVVDGQHLKHKVTELNSKIRLLCYLPTNNSAGNTSVVLKFPEQPTNAHDIYEFCLSDVHCVPKMTIAKLAGKLLK